jgi:hypothetical protein
VYLKLVDYGWLLVQVGLALQLVLVDIIWLVTNHVINVQVELLLVLLPQLHHLVEKDFLYKIMFVLDVQVMR